MIYVYNLLNLKLFYKPTLDSEIKKLTSILFKQADHSVVGQTIEQLQQLNSIALSKTDKRDWGNILYNAFRLSPEKTKSQIYSYVMKIGVKNTFRKDLSNHIRSFSEEEETIIKSIA